MRKAVKERETGETKVKVEINLDGSGNCSINTGIGFFDHMLKQIGRHGGFDLNIFAEGDLEIDGHHTVEDIGITMGQAFLEALGDKKGISRFSSVLIPLDESLVRTVVDISGRSFLYTDLQFSREKVGDFPSELAVEFLRAFAYNGGITLHVELMYGENCHHQIEAVFKSLARALKLAVKVDSDQIPSTKGVL
ncbi:MAG: imidazoleglycerol-phosphate dehydratase HisB [Bacillota bacterium]